MNLSIDDFLYHELDNPKPNYTKEIFMKQNFYCPSCKAKVSFARMMLYIPPFTMECKICKENMQVSKNPIVTFAILYSFFTIIGMWYVFILREHINFLANINDFILILICLSIWILITELPIYYLYKKWNIELVKESNFISKNYRWTILLQIVLFLIIFFF